MEELSSLTKRLEHAYVPWALVDENWVLKWSNSSFKLSFTTCQDNQACTPRLDDLFILPSESLSTIRHDSPLRITVRRQSAVTLPVELHLISVVPPLAIQDLAVQQRWLVVADPAPPVERPPRVEASPQRPDSFGLEELTHDLRNPIGAILGFADALLHTPLAAGLTERQGFILQRIRETAFRATEMIHNYQILSRIQNDPTIPTTTPVDLSMVCRGLEQQTRLEAEGSRSLQLSLCETPLTVAAPWALLERIISNLLVNALKYTPPGEVISLRTEMDPSKAFAVVHVHNTKPAIPKDEQDIFTRYSRRARDGSRPGSGLGLYIVYTLTQALGGKVYLDSDEDRGTTFSVSIPLVKGELMKGQHVLKIRKDRL